jgi:hypothetical protein
MVNETRTKSACRYGTVNGFFVNIGGPTGSIPGIRI